MIRTWVADVTPLTEPELYETYYALVPDERKKKADRLRFAKDKALSIGAWSLYMRMKEYYELSERTVFNLSHSGRYALCSVGDDRWTEYRVGCDIEYVKHNYHDIARRFFCPDETAYIHAKETEAARAQAFFRYWVLKESFMKATRLGMKLPLNEFEIRFDAQDYPLLVKQPAEILGQYYYKEYAVSDPDVKIAVCSTKDEFEELTCYTFGEL